MNSVKYFYRNRFTIVIVLLLFVAFLIFQKRNQIQRFFWNTPIQNSDALKYSIDKNVFQQVDNFQLQKSPIKILCLINSSKKTLKDRAIHVNETWARRCDKHYFLSYDKDLNLPFINTKIPEIRRNLWNKWRAAFQWISENKIENCDYIVRTDDDSYFIMENLRAFLLPYKSNDTYIFGTFFKPFVKTGYISGGPGMIFTREALKLLVSAMYKPEICPEISEGDDDVEIGACADKLNITKIETRDHQGRLTQLPWSPAAHFTTGLNFDQLRYLFSPYKQKKRFECCSDYMISFHYIYKELIYTFEFLIYKTKMFRQNNSKIPQKENI